MTRGYLALAAVAYVLMHADVASAEGGVVVLNVPVVTEGNPMTVKVSGKYSVPNNQVNDRWRIQIDYVTIGNGTVSVWMPGPAIALAPVGGALTAWSQLAPTTLDPNPPAELYVRVRLQRLENTVFFPFTNWFTKSTAAFQITPSKLDTGPPMDN